KVLYQILLVLTQLVIFAPEWDDFYVYTFRCEACNLVGVQSGAVDHQPGIVRLPSRRYMGHTLVDVDALYLFAQEKASARLLEYFGVLLRHHTEVDNTRLRHQYATDARCMGLVFPDLLGRQHGKRLQSVLQSALIQGLKHGQLALVGGDDNLGTQFVWDVVALAEVDQHVVPPDAVEGFQAARFVVQTGVDNATVIASLVAADTIFFFQDGDFQRGIGGEQLQAGGQSNYAATDNKHIVLHAGKISPKLSQKKHSPKTGLYGLLTPLKIYPTSASFAAM